MSPPQRPLVPPPRAERAEWTEGTCSKRSSFEVFEWGHERCSDATELAELASGGRSMPSRAVEVLYEGERMMTMYRGN
jgi:hypothetical protein